MWNDFKIPRLAGQAWFTMNQRNNSKQKHNHFQRQDIVTNSCFKSLLTRKDDGSWLEKNISRGIRVFTNFNRLSISWERTRALTFFISIERIVSKSQWLHCEKFCSFASSLPQLHHQVYIPSPVLQLLRNIFNIDDCVCPALHLKLRNHCNHWPFAQT